MKPFLFVISILCLQLQATAQTITQTVKGLVIDKASEKPLDGVTVQVLGSKTATAITNKGGQYTINGVATGRVTLIASFVGFKTVAIPEVLVTSGKQVIVDISLEQELKSLSEVTVTASRIRKGNSSNEFAATSSRSFSMEEVTRFAGGRNDPSKLVSSFAGVISSSDSRNDIVVRGNSPSGVLWRLEGIPTANPNHFATSGTTGGPVSALNTNALKTSDFYTGAFPAEYGNANAAVFDMQLRTGNTSKQESTVQLNLFSGLEAMLEGPLGKKNNGASYLIGYRYSFVQIAKSMGINVGTSAIPKYQDWVYNIQFAKSKAGKFSLFGMGGYSNIDFLGKKTDTTDFYARQDQDGYVNSSLNVAGLKHTIDAGSNAYVKTVVSYATTKSNFDLYQYALPLVYTNRWLIIQTRNTTNTVRIASLFNQKVNARLSWRTGFIGELFNINSHVQSREGKTATDAFADLQNYKGNSSLWQVYAQGRYKAGNRVTLTGGLNGIYHPFSEKSLIQPRFGTVVQLGNTQTLAFNYGLHGQLQPLPVYLYQAEVNGTLNQSNRKLDFTKAHHFVLGYEKRLGKDWRAKAEAYYQYLFDVPVEQQKTGFSMLNAGADFTFPEKAGLVNTGTGKNYGVELTIERFLNNGFYVLTTGSIFKSTYKGSDGIERNTTFDYGYATNVLAGREWKTGKDKKNAFTVDVKLTALGGRFVTPVNLAASIAASREVLDENKYNSDQLKGYFRLDTKFGIRINSSKRKMSQTFYLDLQNITNQQNIFLRRYNGQKQRVGELNQIGFFPDLLYRIQF